MEPESTGTLNFWERNLYDLGVELRGPLPYLWTEVEVEREWKTTKNAQSDQLSFTSAKENAVLLQLLQPLHQTSTTMVRFQAQATITWKCFAYFEITRRDRNKWMHSTQPKLTKRTSLEMVNAVHQLLAP